MTKISLEAARINAKLSQQEVADAMSKHFNTKYSRQRISTLERNSGETSVKEAIFLSDLYKLPFDNIFFES